MVHAPVAIYRHAHGSSAHRVAFLAPLSLSRWQIVKFFFVPDLNSGYLRVLQTFSEVQGFPATLIEVGIVFYGKDYSE